MLYNKHLKHVNLVITDGNLFMYPSTARAAQNGSLTHRTYAEIKLKEELLKIL